MAWSAMSISGSRIVVSAGPIHLATGDAWVLTSSSAITNVSCDQLDIGSPTTNGRENAGDGGLFWRGPRNFTGGTIAAAGYGAGEQIRGTREEWTGHTGQHDHSARHSSLVMVDDTTNPATGRSGSCATRGSRGQSGTVLQQGGGVRPSSEPAVPLCSGDRQWPAGAQRGQRLAGLGRAALAQR